MNGILKKTGIVLVVLACAGACASYQKLQNLKEGGVTAGVSMADAVARTAPPISSSGDAPAEEKLAVVDIQGKVWIMNAVRDEESGEMVVSDRLAAVVVEATFRNIPERNGLVEIAFEITIPEAMRHSRWQVRLAPRLALLEDTLLLDKVYITGDKYHAARLRGYELYNRYVRSIVPDSVSFGRVFAYQTLLDIYIDRNFRNLAALRTDSSLVDTAGVSGLFGVTEKEAVEHYTKQFLVRRNERRKRNLDKKYIRYVKVPFEKEGIRLDSVVFGTDSLIHYHYVQTFRTRKGLKKADLLLGGAVYEADRKVYTVPECRPLTYYISSMASLADSSIRYRKKIIERNAQVKTTACIDFRAGEYTVCTALQNNSHEIGRIQSDIREIFSDADYIADSLIITASCSPEGTYHSNARLAEKRAVAIKSYLLDYVHGCLDSVLSPVWDINLAGKGDGRKEKETALLAFRPDFIKTRAVPESWDVLQKLVQEDTNLTDRDAILKCFSVQDPDAREQALSRTGEYGYIRKLLYPRLRRVQFDFYLHRRGMVKDTVHTQEIDTVYMRGIKALDERDYVTAVALLSSYRDLNAAVAYLCSDYNQSALSILERIKKTARRDYMLAVVYARLHEERKAVASLMDAVARDPSLQHRGNLDPEISGLIRKYGIDFNN